MCLINRKASLTEAGISMSDSMGKALVLLADLPGVEQWLCKYN